MKPEPMPLSALTVSHESPPTHEPWCDDAIFGDYSYVACTCNLEGRLVVWQSKNRVSGAAELPRAIARRRR